MASLKRDHPGDEDADAPPAKTNQTRDEKPSNAEFVQATIMSIVVSNTDVARSDECADSVTPDVFNVKIPHYKPGDADKPTRLQRAMAVIAEKGYAQAVLYMRRKEPYGNPLWRALIGLIEEPYYEAINERESDEDAGDAESEDEEEDEEDEDDGDEEEDAALEDADAGDFKQKVLPSVAAEAAAKAKAAAQADEPYVMPVVTSLTAKEFAQHMNRTRKINDAQPCIEPLRLGAGERFFTVFVEPEVVAE